MIVLDANVAAKWLLPEKGTEAALALQEGPDQLFAPALIRLEVAGSITRRLRTEKAKDRLTPEDALGRCERWFRILDEATLSLIPESELLEQAVKLSIEIKHSLHDCMYLAAAKGLGARLITADRRFYDIASPAYGHVEMLAGCENN
jgi:predicted nucleic acid-binding protein